ncbi:hypothetical protein BDV59DRAFT_189278 [Aspergillus ambiguus]|uniref:uncharacterized protein n=1 Tax=Aspergillus ambiguus TaxID=176160 RepID=UPI003CCDE046
MTAPSDTTKRLHITPFTPDLLPAVLPGNLRSSATEISYHHIPTFPENDYGYVTLPAMDAEKVKKKLNGSILKGRKFKVDNARPPKRQREEHAEDPVPDHKPPKEKKQKKKSKDEYSVFEGYELPPDRQVKRGWTESTTSLKERRKEEKKRKEKGDKKSKSQAKSKYTEKSECLFRTKVPANRSSVDEKNEKTHKKKKKPAQESVVHEFEKTISHPSFVRSGNDGTQPTSTFEEGKGWVDASGNVKEEVNSRVKGDQHHPGKVPGAKEKRKSVEVDSKTRKSKAKVESPEESAEESEDWTSSSGESSSDDSASDSESEAAVSSRSSDESDGSSSDEEEEEVLKTPNKQTAVKGGGPSLDEDTTGTNNGPPTEVHPLEALFKRPATDDATQNAEPEANAQFSFFGQGDIEESEEEAEKVVEPHTPFTKRDLQARGLRSAAPTPDTSMVGRTIKWNTDGDSMEVDDSYANTPVPKGASPAKEESEFTKWFWENRGDNNRAWKKRRRDVAKEQRQRDNRSKGMRGKS